MEELFMNPDFKMVLLFGSILIYVFVIVAVVVKLVVKKEVLEEIPNDDNTAIESLFGVDNYIPGEPAEEKQPALDDFDEGFEEDDNEYSKLMDEIKQNIQDNDSPPENDNIK